MEQHPSRSPAWWLAVTEGQTDLKRCFSLLDDCQGNLGDLAGCPTFREEMSSSLVAAALAQNRLLKNKRRIKACGPAPCQVEGKMSLAYIAR